jgi:hypothetical protein
MRATVTEYPEDGLGLSCYEFPSQGTGIKGHDDFYPAGDICRHAHG